MYSTFASLSYESPFRATFDKPFHRVCRWHMVIHPSSLPYSIHGIAARIR